MRKVRGRICLAAFSVDDKLACFGLVAVGCFFSLWLSFNYLPLFTRFFLSFWRAGWVHFSFFRAVLPVIHYLRLPFHTFGGGFGFFWQVARPEFHMESVFVWCCRLIRWLHGLEQLRVATGCYGDCRVRSASVLSVGCYVFGFPDWDYPFTLQRSEASTIRIVPLAVVCFFLLV